MNDDVGDTREPNPDCQACGGRGWVLLPNVRYHHPVKCEECFPWWGHPNPTPFLQRLIDERERAARGAERFPECDEFLGEMGELYRGCVQRCRKERAARGAEGDG